MNEFLVALLLMGVMTFANTAIVVRKWEEFYGSGLALVAAQFIGFSGIVWLTLNSFGQAISFDTYSRLTPLSEVRVVWAEFANLGVPIVVQEPGGTLRFVEIEGVPMSERKKMFEQTEKAKEEGGEVILNLLNREGSTQGELLKHTPPPQGAPKQDD